MGHFQVGEVGQKYVGVDNPANHALRQKLRTGELHPQDYYRQVLRLVYRMLILFVAEDRGVLFHPQADEQAQARYRAYYSTARLRRLPNSVLGRATVTSSRSSL